MNILFVCTGNTCRSPMAEGILNDLAGKGNLDINSKSVGILARDGGRPANNAIKVMEDIGIDISKSKSQMINENILDKADIILTMSKNHKESLLGSYPKLKGKVYLLNEYAFNENKDIEDPFGGDIKIYEQARDEIYKAIEIVVKKEE